MTNYTVGSSIFCKVHLRVFDFLTFILQGPQFYEKYTLGLSKIGIFSYILGLGVRPNILTPRHFLLEVPPGFVRDDYFVIFQFYLSTLHIEVRCWRYHDMRRSVSLRWSETKNLKISNPDNTFFLYQIMIKLCTLKHLKNINQKLKLKFS